MSSSGGVPQIDPSSLSEPENNPTIVRHSIYYFEPVVFRVEGVLFKVPKNGFMVAETMFPDLFSLPPATGDIVEGSSDSKPIDLPVGISQTDFHGFLLVMYPYFSRDHGNMRYEELVGALKLATMWEFPQIREKAISSLSPIIKSRNVVQNIILAKEYRVKHWLREGYMQLVHSPNLTIQDLRHPLELEWETIAGIFATQSYSRRGTNLGLSTEDYLAMVFEREFNSMQ